MNTTEQRPYTYICTRGNKYRCPNMKERENDFSMDYEHYECKVCGQTYKLDYEEMK